MEGLCREVERLCREGAGLCREVLFYMMLVFDE